MKIVNDTNAYSSNNEEGLLHWASIPEYLSQKYAFGNEYPIDAFPEILQLAIIAIAKHVQIPLAVAGQCILGAISTIGQCYVNAPMPNGQYMPASLFLLTELESGAGKTQAHNLAQRAIIQWNEQANRIFAASLKQWEQDCASYGKKRSAFMKDKPKPKNKIFDIKDATIEAILDRFIVYDIKNQSWTTDEAGQILNGHSLTSDTAINAIANLTSIWSTGKVQRLRSQRNPWFTVKTNADDVRLTLNMMGQRVVLEPIMNNEVMNGQGFLARFLMICPESLIGKRRWNTAEQMNTNIDQDPHLMAYWQRCEVLLGALPDHELANHHINSEHCQRLNMPFADPHARQTLANFQQSVEDRLDKNGVFFEYKSFASRMAENASRVATLIAFFDGHKTLNAEYLQRGIALVEYSMLERMKYSHVGKTNIEKLLDWLVTTARKNQSDTVNRGYASRYAPYACRGKKLQPLLDDLEDMGYIQVRQHGKKKEIHIHPDLITLPHSL